MISNFTSQRILKIFFLTLILLLSSQSLVFGAKKNKNENYVMTELELQSELMSFADRFSNTVGQSFLRFEASGPSREARHRVLNMGVYAAAAAWTIAAEPNPQTALLDMVVITTLGHMVYKETLRKRFGEPIEDMVKGFEKLEKDIWQVASKILSKEQQNELRELILDWRKRNPDKILVNFYRFSDFAADRRKSTLVQQDRAGGIFKSVQMATQEVEQTRALVERGLYLSTRIPLLIGRFSELWFSQLLVTPETQRVLQDVHVFSDVSQRLATVAEQVPDQLMKDISKLRLETIDQVMKEIDLLSDRTVNNVMDRVAVEREEFIDHFMDRLFGEQKIALKALVAEEQRLTGMAAELRKTLEAGDSLLASATALTEKFGTGEPSAKPQNSEPFDINDYKATVMEVANTADRLTRLVETTNRLVGSTELTEVLPKLVDAIGNVQQESKALIDHSFRQALLLIVIGVVAYFVAKLTFSYLHKKLICIKLLKKFHEMFGLVESISGRLFFPWVT